MLVLGYHGVGAVCAWFLVRGGSYVEVAPEDVNFDAILRERITRRPLRRGSRGRNCVRLGAPEPAGDGVVTCVEVAGEEQRRITQFMRARRENVECQRQKDHKQAVLTYAGSLHREERECGMPKAKRPKTSGFNIRRLPPPQGGPPPSRREEN